MIKNNGTGSPWKGLPPKRRVARRAALLLSIGLAVGFLWFAAYALSKGPENSNTTAIVTIPKGTSVQQIGHILGDAGLIHDDVRFYILAKITGLAGKLQAGEFRLNTAKLPMQLMKQLQKAAPVQHAITIREGLRASEIAMVFASDGWCDNRSYETLVSNQQFIEKLGFKGLASLEGYLYPDTYNLTFSMKGAESLITMQVKRFLEVWEDLGGAKTNDVDRQKIVILASMVEKETADPEERPLIAAVFLNRLKLGMRLQSDPTVVYGLKDYPGTITKMDLQTPTPYNTYTLTALPAGPIANPGKDALSAVLHPTETKYLYFVSKNDGTHQFSTSLNEHNEAVQAYQRKTKDKNVK